MSFAANITSHETGIGNWTEEQFIRALREGKYKGLPNGRLLLPPMPWPYYGQLNDEALRAIFAFLKSTKPGFTTSFLRQSQLTGYAASTRDRPAY